MVAIALANQKGGVGKTTTTLGLAESACAAGLNVLVIDCDPQANATSGLGVELDENSLTLADLLEEERSITQDEFDRAIIASPWTHELKTGARIDVIVSHPRLATLETQLASDPIGACDRLALVIADIADNYDVILMDCPPSMGLLTINALFAADEVVIVSAPSAWSSDGVEAFVRNIERIAARRSGKPEISGIIVNNVGRTRDGKYWEAEISQRYSFNVASVASRAAIAESAAMSVPLASLGARPGAEQGRKNFSDVFYSIIGLGAEPRDITLPEKVTAKSIAAAV
jgi:chromosome partitioning protein